MECQRGPAFLDHHVFPKEAKNERLTLKKTQDALISLCTKHRSASYTFITESTSLQQAISLLQQVDISTNVFTVVFDVNLVFLTIAMQPSYTLPFRL